MPSIAPSLDDLREELSRAERDVVCADMIDREERRQAELARTGRRVAEIKGRIARLEETF